MRDCFAILSTELYHVLIRTSTVVGAQDCRAGEAGRLSTSLPAIRANFYSHDSFETFGFVGKHVKW